MRTKTETTTYKRPKINLNDTVILKRVAIREISVDEVLAAAEDDKRTR